MGIFDFFKKNKDIENDNGLNEIYYDNGRGELKERFSKKNGKKYGVYEEWHDNGKIKFTTNYKDDIQEGKTWVYDKSGNILREYMIIDGYIEDEIKYEKGVKINGKYEEWKEPFTGEKFLEKLINYKNGKKHGTYEKYDQDGSRVLKCNYKNNKKDGISVEYYENGYKRFTTNYKDGLQEGRTCIYDIDCHLLRESKFAAGKRIGDSIEYYKNGSLRMICKGTKYTFFVWKENHPNGLKRCEIDIEITDPGTDESRYGIPQASNPIFKNIWTNFRNDGSIEYTLDFTDDRSKGKRVIKTNYSSLGSEISSELVSFKFKKTSHLKFHSHFSFDRLIGKKDSRWVGPRPSISNIMGANLEGRTLPSGDWVEDSHFSFFHTYNTGVMGPPGVGTGKIGIKLILGLDDIVQII